MEIKYTLEILTKDIQDIEKLVANLQNSPNGSTLELDLALSKLRNVYDMLTMIRTDMGKEVRRQEPVKAEQAELSEPAPIAGEEAPVVEESPTSAPPKEAESSGTVAEKFSAESSINENMAGNRKQDADAAVLGGAIESISRNIGINDRFFIIRELFDGDSDSFSKLIVQLDGAGDYKAAMQLLQTRFEHAPDHEGISILTNLVRRKYNRN